MHNLNQVVGRSVKDLYSFFPRWIWLHRNGCKMQDLKDNQVWQYKFCCFHLAEVLCRSEHFVLPWLFPQSESSIVALHIYYIYFTIQSVLWMHFHVSWLLPFNPLAIPCSRQANILKIYLMFSNFFHIFGYIYSKHGQGISALHVGAHLTE